MNKINIKISSCEQCRDFRNGGINIPDHCANDDLNDARVYIYNKEIPNNCPRLKKERAAKPIVVFVNGYPEAGKDLFCGFASDYYETIKYSTVDTIKESAEILGYNGIKTPENRDMLSALKDFSTKWFDGPFVEMTTLIDGECRRKETKDFIFIHSREPDEILRMVNWCDEESIPHYSIFIKRDVEKAHNNHADANVENGHYDIYIENNGTKDKFRVKSLAIFAEMKDNTIYPLF